MPVLSPLRKYRPDPYTPEPFIPNAGLPGANLPGDFSSSDEDDDIGRMLPPPIPPLPKPESVDLQGEQKQIADAAPPQPNPSAKLPGARALNLTPPPPPPPRGPAPTSAATPPFLPSPGPIAPPPPPSIAPQGPPPAPVSATLQKRQQLEPPPPPKPSWLRRLGATALAAGSGYVNARGRSYIPPEQTEAAVQNILYPGYGQQLANYERQRKALDDRLNLELKEEQVAGQREYRKASAEERRARASKELEDNETKRQIAADKIEAENRERQRKGFEALTKNVPVVYRGSGSGIPGVNAGVAEEAPEGWQAVPIQNPDMPGMTAYTPSATAKVPKELVPYLPGYKEGDQVDRQTLNAASKDYREELKKQNLQDNKPDKETLEAWTAAAAAGDEAAKRKIEIFTRAKASEHPHEPKEPSAAKLKQEQDAKVRQLAQRAMNESRAGGGGSYDDAIANVQKFYQDDGDMQASREDVIGQLNRWKLSGMRPEQVQASLSKNEPAFSLSPDGKLVLNPKKFGGKGAPAPQQKQGKQQPGAKPQQTAAAPPPAQATPAGKPLPNVGDIKYLQGKPVKITKVYPDGTADYDAATPEEVAAAARRQ